MNAINFIKHYGLNTAIRITEDSKNDDFWDTETAFYTDKNSESCVCISELKRVVESMDYVAIHGYEKSKEILKNTPAGAECYSWSIGNSGVRDKTVELAKLKQAIADYELLFCSGESK